MLAMARALMTKPRLLLLDEPSMGLAPVLVRGIFQTIAEINRQGTTVLLVEQNANAALRLARRTASFLASSAPSPSRAIRPVSRTYARRAYLGVGVRSSVPQRPG
jgi:branched-chain amino acid transport system ATP-binding protein